MESDKDIEKWLKKNFETIFSKELDSWFVDVTDWPKKMSYKMFSEWFSVKRHSRVIDLEPFAE